MRPRVLCTLRCREFFFAELKAGAKQLRAEFHRLAKTYHWPPSELRGLETRERKAYLRLIEADEDAALLAALTS